MEVFPAALLWFLPSPRTVHAGAFSVIQPYASHYRYGSYGNICDEDAVAPCVANHHDGRDESKQDGGADDEFQDFHIKASRFSCSIATTQPPTFRTVSVEQAHFFRGELFQAMLAQLRVEVGQSSNKTHRDTPSTPNRFPACRFRTAFPDTIPLTSYLDRSRGIVLVISYHTSTAGCGAF